MKNTKRNKALQTLQDKLSEMRELTGKKGEEINNPLTGSNKYMREIICKYLGFHQWEWFESKIPFIVIYKCKNCDKLKEDYQGQ